MARLLLLLRIFFILSVSQIHGQLQQERFPTLFASQFQTPTFVQRRPQMVAGFVGPINPQLIGAPSQQIQKVVVPVRILNGKQQQMEIDVNRLPQNVKMELFKQQQQRQQQLLLAQMQQQKLRQEQQRLQLQQQIANQPRLPSTNQITTTQLNNNFVENPKPFRTQQQFHEPVQQFRELQNQQLLNPQLQRPQNQQFQPPQNQGPENQQFLGTQNQQFQGPQNQQFQGPQNLQFQGPQNQQFQGAQNQQFQRPQNQPFQGQQNNGAQNQQFQGQQNQLPNGPQSNQFQIQQNQFLQSQNQQFDSQHVNQGQEQNQQFNRPQNQPFNRPQNQQFNGPQIQQFVRPQNQQQFLPQQNQQFNGPQNQQFSGPENQQFNGQQNQQFNGQQNQQFQESQNQQIQAPQNPQQIQAPQNPQQIQAPQNPQQIQAPQNPQQIPNNFLRQQHSLQPQQDVNFIQQQQFRNNLIQNNEFTDNEQLLRQPNFNGQDASLQAQFNQFNEFLQQTSHNTMQRPNIEFGGFIPLTTSNSSIDDISNEISSKPSFLIPVTTSNVLSVTENTIPDIAHSSKQIGFTSVSKPDFTVGINSMDTIESSTAMPAVSTSSSPFKTSIFTKTIEHTSQKPRRVKVGCEGGLGFCDVNDNYPRNRVAFLTSKCRDLISKMFVPLPDTFEETSNVSASVRQDEACSSEKRFLKPGFAVDDHGKWQVIIQTHEISQRVIIEMCRTPQHSCSGLTDTRSRCVQKFSFQLLMALDPERPDDCPAMRAVRVPTSCTCQIDAPRISI